MKFKQITAVFLCLVLLTVLVSPIYSDGDITVETIESVETLPVPSEDIVLPNADVNDEYNQVPKYFSYRLRGGIDNGKYYVGVSATKYVNACHAAISAWNDICEPTPHYDGDFEFTQTTTLSNANIRFWGEYNDEVLWEGQTRFIMADGSMCPYDQFGNVDTSQLTEDWVKASCVFNTAWLDSANQNWVIRTANHEVGHAAGLADRLYYGEALSIMQDDISTLMYPTTSDGVVLSMRYSIGGIELTKTPDEVKLFK